MQLLNSTRKDYDNIKNKVWPIVVKEGNIEDSERSQIKDFIKNVKNLTAQDNPSYKCLGARLKQELSIWLNFANNLERQLPSIPPFRGNNNNNNDPYTQTS